MVLIPGHELMDEAAISRALIRISHEIVEHNGLEGDLAQELQDGITDPYLGYDGDDKDDEYELEQGLLAKALEPVEDALKGIPVVPVVDHILDHESSVDVVQEYEKDRGREYDGGE